MSAMTCTACGPRSARGDADLRQGDSHAEDITRIVREEFGKGNEFCKKITYRAQDPQGLIKEFRIQHLPRIAVSVDMVSTGTDIRPLECLLFLRDVKSPTYYEQMKGRGCRTIKPDCNGSHCFRSTFSR